jgi:hypothetical protein
MHARLFLFISAFFVAPILCSAQVQWGEFKGVVTYESEDGRKLPDTGTEVNIYLIDTVRPSAEKHLKLHIEDSLINNSFMATIYYEEFAHTPIGRTQKDMIRKLKALNAYPDEKRLELDSFAANVINERESKICSFATVDKRGNYSFILPPGYYGVIFRSGHLSSNTKTEGNGNIRLEDIWIKKGATVIKNIEML